MWRYVPSTMLFRSQRVSRHKETEIALDDAALVFGQAVGVFPQRDVTRHVHLLRHPVIGASRKVLLPCPLVLEGLSWLAYVCLAVDDAACRQRSSAMSGCGQPLWQRMTAAVGCNARVWMGSGDLLRCLVAVAGHQIRWFYDGELDFFVPGQRRFSSDRIMKGVLQKKKH